MNIIFLGTGTSQGIPVIGSTHPVCLSNDHKDKRLRASVMLTTPMGKKILIDCGPDFRQQMLAQNQGMVDAVLLTHEHNDHVIGLDDLRPIVFQKQANVPIYALPRVLTEVEQRFPYAFAQNPYPGAPRFDLHPIEDQKFKLFDIEIEPIPVMHGQLPILGFRIGALAYITDASFISENSLAKLQNLDILVINCLRATDSHPTHFILPEVLALAEQLKPKKVFLTHISHHLGFHEVVEKDLPENIFLAYDGKKICI
jgi:phosphoribosyl 1,2-cyclic phosphate phosphodiesterase